MYHVLLPVDENADRSVAAAETIASLPGATGEIEVVVLNVFERLDINEAEAGTVSSDDLYEASDYPESVAAATAVLADADIPFETRREHGDITDEILRVATEEGVDHIVMAARKRTPVGKMLFGSVAQAVILDADVPVTVAPRRR